MSTDVATQTEGTQETEDGQRQKGGRKVSRRTLLVGAGAAGVLSGGGLWATRQPGLSFAGGTYEGTRPGRVLVAYDSRYGTTGGVADTIGRVLARTGPTVDVARIDALSSVDGYDAVVVGAPVHTDEWKPEATEFIGRYGQQLTRVPVALFNCSMSYALDPDRGAQTNLKTDVLRAAAATVPGLKPVAIQPFGGALDYGSMMPAAGLIYRLVAGDATSGDYRDWPVIEAWARELGPRLTA